MRTTVSCYEKCNRYRFKAVRFGDGDGERGGVAKKTPVSQTIKERKMDMDMPLTTVHLTLTRLCR